MEAGLGIREETVSGIEIVVGKEEVQAIEACTKEDRSKFFTEGFMLLDLVDDSNTAWIEFKIMIIALGRRHTLQLPEVEELKAQIHHRISQTDRHLRDRWKIIMMIRIFHFR